MLDSLQYFNKGFELFAFIKKNCYKMNENPDENEKVDFKKTLECSLPKITLQQFGPVWIKSCAIHQIAGSTLFCFKFF